MSWTEERQADDHRQLDTVAVKLFLAICEEWALSEEQRLTLAGLSSRSSLHNWRRQLESGQGVRIGRDTRERLSWIAGIYKALQLLFPERSRWREWVHSPNTDFGGQSALQRMLGGRVVDLADVRRYLDGWRGEHYA